ncbi:mitochondrial FAD-linked sulfhydryl oxidase Erv1p [Monosporozyma unispora]|nr:hypothetical protein C6P44_003808 [Kazachstania unispora]
MSNSQDEPITLSNFLFNKDGKFCLPCTAYRGFQYVTTEMTNRYQVYKNNKLETLRNAQPQVNIMNQDTATLPVQGANNEMIPGSRTYVKEDPPDVQKLGVASWTFLHTMAAKYPREPTQTQKEDMSEFLKLFSHVYPCNWCAMDFEKYITKYSPRVESKEELSRWMCEAHNHVNVKLGKPKFNCDFWQQRWKDGWEE